MDCMATISPHRANVVNITNSDTQTTNVINFFSPLSSSSYGVFDSGYKYTYDRFNNKFRYIPTNADIAGLMCRTSITLLILGSHLQVNSVVLLTMLLNLHIIQIKHKEISYIHRELTLS